MKAINSGLAALVISFLFSSCLKSNLPELPLWENNFVTNVFIEHRYNGPQSRYNEPIVVYQKLTVSNMVVDSVKNRIEFTITVPPPVGSFTAEERAKVRQDHLWVYMDISTAATVAPTGNTPRLGDPTDLTKEQTYEVTAANGDKRPWTIAVTSFNN